MDHYAGIDVSLEYSSVCVVDVSGKIIREGKVLSEPAALIAWFGSLGFGLARIGLEAGPLSQWLYAGLKQAGLEWYRTLRMHIKSLGYAQSAYDPCLYIQGPSQFVLVYMDDFMVVDVKEMMVGSKWELSRKYEMRNFVRTGSP